MSMYPEGKSCTELGRVLDLNDPPAWRTSNPAAKEEKEARADGKSQHKRQKSVDVGKLESVVSDADAEMAALDGP